MKNNFSFIIKTKYLNTYLFSDLVVENKRSYTIKNKKNGKKKTILKNSITFLRKNTSLF